MVCLGNICRSPLAEGILKSKIAEKGLDWIVESRGTGSWHVGGLPDSRSIEVGRNHGIDITDQRAQQIKKQDLSDFDLIYGMDTSNYNNILKMCHTDKQKSKVAMILNESQPGYNQSVPDPYWNDGGFEGVYQMLDKACDAIIARVNS